GSAAGQVVASSGTTLEFGGGPFTFKSTSGITGTGTVSILFDFGASVDVSGKYTLASATGSTTVGRGAIVHLYGTTTPPGSALNIESGTADFVQPVSIGTLSQSGGVLTGPAAVTTTGNSSWTGGMMSGSGSTNFPAGKVLTLGGSDGSETLDHRTVTSAGI